MKDKNMKNPNKALFLAAAAAVSGLTTEASAQYQPAGHFASVQYGQGGPVAFFKPSAKQSALPNRAAKQPQTKLRWAQQSIPNGSVITYAISEPKPLEMAPLK